MSSNSTISELAAPANSSLGLLDNVSTELGRLGDANQVCQWNTRNKKLSVLMPVFNERWTLARIMERVLGSSTGLQLEIVVVDDGSTDGSGELLRSIAAADSRVRVICHDRNMGKGAAIQSAAQNMTGDVAVIQDADLEYDPGDYARMLAPILQNQADAVFGSRFAGTPRRVFMFWHSVGSHALTFLSNMINDLNLTDMGTGYKMIRADLLKQLCLKGQTFTFDAELTCRLAQWGARIFEVPISYAGRSYDEGKKLRAGDLIKMVYTLFHCRLFDTQFTKHTGMHTLKSVARARRYNRWLLRKCSRYLGDRILEAGAGIGNMSALLLNHQRLVAVDHDPVYVSQLKQRWGDRSNVRPVEANLTDPDFGTRWRDEELDTVFCSNVLEHVEFDQQVLDSFHDALIPGGHCVLIVPAGPRFYTRLDRALGHFRRYTEDELRKKMETAGLRIKYAKRFSKVGAIAWWINGYVLRRSHLTPRQMVWFDRLWPISRLFDYCLPIPGMSLLMVGQRPT